VSELLDHVKRLAASADQYDLIDAAQIIADAKKRKEDEHRTLMLRVDTCGLIVGHFASDDMAGALNYLLEHVGDVDPDVRILTVRIPDSEVAENLATRWWPIERAKKAASTPSQGEK